MFPQRIRKSKDRMSGRHTIVLAVAIACVWGIQSRSFAESGLQTGQPLTVGTENGVGVFALPSISCSPLGAANVFGAKRPDLFVVSDRWHPDLLLYRWKADDPSGIPIFSQPLVLKAPFKEAAKSASGVVMSDSSGQIFGFWLRARKLIVAEFDLEHKEFKVTSETLIDGLPSRPQRLALRLSEEGRLQGFVTVSDGTSYKPGDFRAPDYEPYDGAGLWRGGLPRHGIYRFSCNWPNLPKRVESEMVLPAKAGGLLGISSLAWIRATNDSSGQLLFGTKLGGIFYVPGAFEHFSNSTSATKIHVTDPHGHVIRHPAVGTNMAAYPSNNGRRTDFIAAGEGGMYYYRYANQRGKRGEPSFEPPRPVLQESAELYSGSLIVPNVVDWNGDDKLDIVAGNAAGQLLFFENRGTNANPQYLPAARIQAGGTDILIR